MDTLSNEELSKKQAAYWVACAPTIDGMLGGYGYIHDVDVQGSTDFLRQLFPDASVITSGRALDCGAGIGRISKHVLGPVGFQKIDLMDVCPKFLDVARTSVNPEQLGDLFESSFDAFTFLERKWTLIWMQWCAIYLRDDEFVSFFARACKSLNGSKAYVVLKENVTKDNSDPIPDNEDHSVTRSDKHLKALWARAGVKIVLETTQRGLPKALFPVRMYALTLA